MRRKLLAVLGLAAAVLGLTIPPAGAADDDRVILVLDASYSMSGDNLLAARAAIDAYVDELPLDVEIGLVTFADEPRVVLTPTLDRGRLDPALDRIALTSDTSLYDSVLTALRIAGDNGSSNVVLFTDGEDTNSRATLEEAAKAVAASDIRLDAVDVRPGQEPGAELGRLADDGGGRIVTADDAGGLANLLAELSRATQTSTQEPVDAPWTSHLGIVLGLSFVGFLAVIGLIVTVATRRQSPAARTQRLISAYGVAQPEARPATGEPIRDRSPVIGAFYSAAGRMATVPRVAERLGVLLARAGWSLKPAEWLLVQFSLVVGGVSILTLVTGSLLAGLPIGLVLGLAGSHGWLLFKAARRVRAFDERLPDALQLLASGLASGFGLAQAADAVAKRGPQPVAGEFARAMAQTRLGTPLEDALDRVADKMASRDLELTVMSIRIQREVGGNLAEVLRTTVATMRERAYLRRQVRALSAEGRLSAYILVGLPIAMAAYMMAFRRDYIRPLYTETIGLAMITAATVSILIGALVMRKMVKVEV